MTDTAAPRIPQPVLDAMRARFVPPKPDPFLSDPAGWVKAKTGEHLWSKQVELLEALVTHRKVAVKAGHGVGKSFIAARIMGWWEDVHPESTTREVTTAPSDYQVGGVLWQEFRKVHKMAELPGRVTLANKWMIDDREVAVGRKPADHEAETRFQGIHDRYVLAILDEAGGCPASIWDGVNTLLTNDDARVLAIGNPTDPASEFAKVCAGAPDDGTSGLSDEGWWVITISVFDSPNFTTEAIDDELRHLLTGQSWVDDYRAKVGEGSPLWLARVLGIFPTDASDGIVPFSFVTKCRAEGQPDPLDSEAAHLGFDPAGEGTDLAYCWLRRGRKAIRSWHWPYTPDPLELAELVLPIIVEHDVASVRIDADGLGWGLSGILDLMHQQGRHSAQSIPIRGQSAPSNPKEFFNTRTEVWWGARERSRLGQWDLSALTDEDVTELTATRYFLNKRGQIQAERKEDMKKRLGKSPDSADALNLAFHEVSFEAISFVDQMASMRID